MTKDEYSHCPKCTALKQWIVHDKILDEDICVICGYNLTRKQFEKEIR